MRLGHLETFPRVYTTGPGTGCRAVRHLSSRENAMTTARFVVTRREALVAAGAAAVAACSPTGTNQSSGANAAAAGPALASAEGACVLTPQSVEGPFYIDPEHERADIRAGKRGVPLKVRLKIVEAAGCTPIAGARIDLWQADAQGIYSGFPGQSDTRQFDTREETFLRGHQPTRADGVAEFMTLWPGWYRGRTAHIHFKVLLAGSQLLTGQIFLPDALSEFIYTQHPLYRRQGLRDTLNATDVIASAATHAAFAGVKEESDFYLATLLVGVDRNASPPGQAGPGALPPGGPDGPPQGERGPPGERGGTALPTGDARLAALIPG
jgi:protocatechuate 3,4-dioxygenase beta subunit